MIAHLCRIKYGDNRRGFSREVLGFCLRQMTSNGGLDVLEAEATPRCHTGDWN